MQKAKHSGKKQHIFLPERVRHCMRWSWWEERDLKPGTSYVVGSKHFISSCPLLEVGFLALSSAGLQHHQGKRSEGDIAGTRSVGVRCHKEPIGFCQVSYSFWLWRWNNLLLWHRLSSSILPVWVPAYLLDGLSTSWLDCVPGQHLVAFWLLDWQKYANVNNGRHFVMQPCGGCVICVRISHSASPKIILESYGDWFDKGSNVCYLRASPDQLEFT